MSGGDRWTLALVQARLRDLAPPAAQAAPPSLEAYIDAASVLAFFDLARLEPVGGKPPDTAVPPELLDSLDRVVPPDGRPCFSLRLDVRRAALKRLVASGKWQSALDANPSRPGVPTQHILEAFLSRSPPVLTELHYRDLWALSEVREWLEGIIEPLPAREEIAARLAQEELLYPMRLRTLGFAGRAADLELLRTYVGARRAAGGGTVFDPLPVTRIESHPPLVFWGIGGVGKSTLISRFVLEHVDVPDDERFPFAYLDFDRPGLDVDRPLTLLLEVVRQCAILAPALAPKLVPLRRTTEEAISLFGRRASERTFDLEVMSELGSALASRYPRGAPVVLVLDTFERAQYARGADLDRLWDFFSDLLRVMPTLRVVIAGRSQIPAKLVHRDRELSGLDEEAALAVLARWKVEDKAIAQYVFKKIGGHPLALRLAADIVAREGSFSVEVQGRVDAEMVQGILYNRILSHLGTENARKLAHPGLVLRFLTPDLIRVVLAEPCGVPVPDATRAEDLFKELRRETALVTEEGDVLRHRKDVRRVMLHLLREEEKKPGSPKRVEEIHRRAVKYFSRDGATPAERAEELYHRLCLDQPAADLDPRSTTEAVHLLKDAVEELPPRARAWLAVELKVEPDPEARQAAELVVWERDAARRVERMLLGSESDLHAALRVLDERKERTETGPLHIVEAEALLRVSEYDDAWAAAERALASAVKRGDTKEQVRALLVQGNIGRSERHLGSALDHLTRAGQIAHGAGDVATYFNLAIQRLALVEEIGDANASADILSEVEAEKRRTGASLPAQLEDRLSARGRPHPARQEDRLSTGDRQALADGMVKRLVSLDALRLLMRYELEVPLDKVSHASDLRGSVADVISYFEAQGRIPDLLRALVRRYPDDSALHAISALGGHTDAPGVPSSKALLPQSQIEDLFRAAVQVGLTAHRDALFAGIDTAYSRSITSAGSPIAQLRVDLASLNTTRLADGRVPLRTWLANAASLSGNHPEGRVFTDVLRAIGGNEAVPVTPATAGPRHIFLACAPEDRKYRDALLAHLSPLVSARKVVVDDETAILPGMDWRAELVRLIEQAHLVVALVSVSLLASDTYAELLDRAERRGTLIVPVLIRAAMVRGTRFEPIQRLPKDGSPIGSPGNDEAWLDVVREIAQILEEHRTAPDPGSASPISARSSPRDGLDSALRPVAEALRSAFPTRSRLDRVLRSELDITLSEVVPQDMAFGEAVQRLVAWAAREDRLTDLLRGALELSPDHEGLRTAAQSFVLSLEGPLARGVSPGLEKVLLRGTRFTDLQAWRSGLDSAVRAVARVERRSGRVGWQPVGTGFLAGPDVLMTAQHVIQRISPDDLRVRFDYMVEHGQPRAGKVVELSPDPVLIQSPTDALNYALIRVVRPVGDDELESGGLRGFLVPSEEPPAPEESVFLVQHPEGGALQVSTGSLLPGHALSPEARTPADRLWYDAKTRPGSSGAPVFTSDFRLVAMHETSLATTGRGAAENGGVAMTAILADLRERGALHLLGRPPGGGRW